MIGAKSNAEDESMVAEGIDLSYIGVFGIWNNDLGKNELICLIHVHSMTSHQGLRKMHAGSAN